MKKPVARDRQCVLFDWGDTVMHVFPEFSGSMEDWPRVEAIEGVREAIQDTRRDALVCLATNAADSGEHAIRGALARVELEDLFDRIFCFEVVGFRKPSPSFYGTIVEQLEVDPDRVFMVGDDFQADVQGATAVGIKSVWFNRTSSDELSDTLFTTIHSFDRLREALGKLGFRRT